MTPLQLAAASPHCPRGGGAPPGGPETSSRERTQARSGRSSGGEEWRAPAARPGSHGGCWGAAGGRSGSVLEDVELGPVRAGLVGVSPPARSGLSSSLVLQVRVLLDREPTKAAIQSLCSHVARGNLALLALPRVTQGSTCLPESAAALETWFLLVSRRSAFLGGPPRTVL